MGRNLRIEYPGALYHVTSRGNEKKDVYLTRYDRTKFLRLLKDVIDKHGWTCHAYCLMGNHYHILIETPKRNLSAGMKLLNATYAQFFNATHNRVGHLWQGRFTSIVVHSEYYFLELCRYIVLNPVRSGFVKHPGSWPYSSFRATAGHEAPNKCVKLDFILDSFHKDRDIAYKKYEEFVRDGIGKESVWKYLKCKCVLGDEKFVRSLLNKVGTGIRDRLLEGMKREGRPTLTNIISGKHSTLKMEIAQAIRRYHYTQSEIARHLNVDRSYICRIMSKQSTDRV